MALTIQTNTAALNAQRSLNKSSMERELSMQRLSSGMRINGAKDDAAGMQISNRLTSQISGLKVAQRNANDGISMAQTAEGAMQESTNILQRMRDLALQSANGSNSAKDRQAVQKEVDALQNELTRIAETTVFGGQKLLDGTYGTKEFQVGANANETISVTLGNMKANNLGSQQTDLESGTVGLGRFGTTAAANDAAGIAGNGVAGGTLTINGRNSEAITVTANDSARAIAQKINAETSSTGVTAEAKTELQLSALANAGTVSFDLNGKSISTNITNKDDLTDLAQAINEKADETGVTANLDSSGKLSLIDKDGDDIAITDFTNSGGGNVRVDVLDQDGNSKHNLNLDGANATADSLKAVGTVRLSSSDSYSVATADVTVNATASVVSTKKDIASIDMGTQKGAQNALAVIDAALGQVDDQRADLGAIQNRFDNTISNLSNISENVSAARSRIRDTDFATETANMTKNQILQQAGTSILAQAKQLPQAALSLIG